MADIATLGLAVDSRPVADASKELDRITEAAKKAEAAAGGFGTKTEEAARKAAAANDNVARSADKVTASFGKWHAAAVRVAAAMGTVAGAFSIAALTRYADAWSDMQSRVGAAIKNMDAAPAMMQRIVDIANASYSPLDQTVEIYGRNVAVLRDLGRTATEAADFTEALNHALVTTATKGQDADVVLNALSRSIAIGGLRSMEFETIMSRSPRVLEAIADELGTNVIQLRALAQQGKVTGDVIVNALINNLEKLRAEAAEMPATIGDAFVRIQTNLTAFVGTMDKAAGASEMAASALLVLADNIGRIVTYVATAVTMFGTYYVAALTAAYLSTITLTGALTLLRAALIRIGIGALVVAAGELVYQFTRLVQAAGGFGNAMSLLGDVATEVWDRIKLGAQALVESLSAGWEGMKATFFYALHDMAAGFANFIGGVAAAINSVFGTDLNTAPMTGMLADLNAAGNTAMVNRNAGRKSAAGLWAQATAPLESIKALQDVMAGAKEATDGAAEAAARLNAALAETGGGGGAADRAAKAIRSVADEAARASQAALDFGKDLVKGFISDLRSGLEQGKSFWESFANAAVRALDKIIDKLLNEVLDAIFRVNQASGGGGILGFLGGLFGGGGGISPVASAFIAGGGVGLFAKGGAFQNGNVIPFARGGIVSQPTIFPMANGMGLMGEAGPEAVMPLRRLPNGRLGVEAANVNHPQPANDYVLTVRFVNERGEEVQRAQVRGGDQSVDVTLDRIMAEKIATPGSATSRAIEERYGLRNRVATR